MPVVKKMNKQMGKLAFLNAIDGTKIHDKMKKLNNCLSGRCDLCHWSVMWNCYKKLQVDIRRRALRSIYKDRTKTK